MTLDTKVVRLYNDEVEIGFQGSKHSYVVVDERRHVNGLVPSVTQILRVLDKPALIGWVAKCCSEFIAEKFQPNKVYRFSPAEVTMLVEEVKNAHRNVSKDARDIGTEAHNWIASYLAKPSKSPKYPSNPAVRRCCQAAVKWIKKVHLKPRKIESIVYSRKYQYLGTMDTMAVVEINGRKAIIDWKSSKGIYPEYRFQLAAYKNAVEEETGLRGLDRYIIKLGKEDGNFEAVKLEDSDYAADLETFLGLMPAQKRLRELSVRP